MSELFTLEPYTCGEYDPTTKYYIPRYLPKNDVELLCVLRNIFGFTGVLISLLGFVGNVFCLIILPKTGGAKSAIILLVSLGIYDATFLIASTFLKYLPTITVLGHMTVVVSNALSPVMSPLTLISHIGASYTTIAISVERCIAITSPFRVLQWVTTRRTKIVSVFILVWSIAFNIPRSLLLAPTTYSEPSLNQTWIRLEPSPLAINGTFLIFYFGYANTVFKVVIPVLIVSISNAVLVYCLRKRRSAFAEHEQISSEHAQSSRTDSRVTTMVLAVTWTFLISQVFAGAQVLFHLLGMDARLEPLHSIVFNQVCDLMLCLVAATNFLLYYAFGQRFRKIMKDLVCRRCTKKSRGSLNTRSGRSGRSDMSMRSTHCT